MIYFDNGGILITSLDELWSIRDNLITLKGFLDVETTSGRPDKTSLNPWHDCDVLGIAICSNLIKSPAYYIPINHKYSNDLIPNLSKDKVAEWLRDIFNHWNEWENANIKYDAHVLKNCMDIDVRDFSLQLICTTNRAKLLNSDRLSYELEQLSLDWLHKDISGYREKFKPYLYDHNGKTYNRDYGVIPIDLMGEYACQDVLTNRDLSKYIDDELSEECNYIAEIENRVTNILFDVEQHGVQTNDIQINIEKVRTTKRLLDIMDRICELSGVYFRPNATRDCYDFLCVHNGLPVLEVTEKNEPSFNKQAMVSYAAHPKVLGDPALKECVELIGEYRKLDIFNNLFLNTYGELKTSDDILHGMYNQSVRTGRFSCSSPNMTQLNKLAKGLILPRPGYSIVSFDLSQIEYRLIGHYINDPNIIREYQENPLADYHLLVAKICQLTCGDCNGVAGNEECKTCNGHGFKRKPAKNLNFAMSFGAGKKKTIEMVKLSLDISADNFSSSSLSFDAYCEQRALQLYQRYHEMMPTLRPTMQQATNTAKSRGYVKTLYRGRRYLERRFCYKAFNSVIQRSAAEIMKHIVVRLDQLTSGTNCQLVAVVHDDFVFEIPTKDVNQWIPIITETIEGTQPPVELRIPIKVNHGYSDVSWAEAG